MKTLLAILLSFAVSEAPVLAIHGGYTLGGAQSVTGTYAGALIPISDELLVATVTTFGKNSLGLFTLPVPAEGIGTGAATIFSNGRTYTGSIQALPDPNSSTGIVGVLTASYNFTEYVTTGTTTTTESLTAQAQGSFDASTVSDPNSPGGLGVDLTGTSKLLIDQAVVDDNGNPVITEQAEFQIEGYQQSTSASSTQ